MEVQFCDELGFSVGWIAADRMMRAGHALATAEGVWVVDPIDAPGVEERVRALGDPAGVIQLTKSHRRDCATIAKKLAVSHHVVPVEPIPAAPFEFLPLADKRFWRESALWWPERRLLVCGDVLGTAPYFLAPGERIGVHPVVRLLRPPRVLGQVEPEHVLCCHGEGLHGPGTSATVVDALAAARRRLPAVVFGGLRRRRRGTRAGDGRSRRP